MNDCQKTFFDSYSMKSLMSNVPRDYSTEMTSLIEDSLYKNIGKAFHINFCLDRYSSQTRGSKAHVQTPDVYGMRPTNERNLKKSKF